MEHEKKIQIVPAAQRQQVLERTRLQFTYQPTSRYFAQQKPSFEAPNAVLLHLCASQSGVLVTE